MRYNNLAWCMLQNSLNVLGGTVSFAPLMGLWFATIIEIAQLFLLQKLTSKIFLHEIFRDNFIFCTDANRPLLNYIQNSPASQFKPAGVNFMSYISYCIKSG